VTIVEDLGQLQSSLKSLKRSITSEDRERISRRILRQNAERLSTHWFGEIAPQLGTTDIAAETVERYSESFSRLLKLSSPNNRKTSYLEVLNRLLKRWRDELILPLQTGAPPKRSLLADVLEDLADPAETEYLQEAITAATHHLFRAAAVLGWCAAMDRIHRRIEKLGFAPFNVESARMASETKGRYKRFTSPQNVHSIAELREVFDTIILWVLEGMALIDTNQHARLRGCFELRSQSAHPGDAPITEYNLLSFFSDINEIVLKNERFSVSRTAPATTG
jgi:hypothetical protein